MKYKYYRLYLGNHVVGFKRISIDCKEITEYKLMGTKEWQKKSIEYDSSVYLRKE